jgi:tripartite ATP-independent transporter DctP family solute receptor
MTRLLCISVFLFCAVFSATASWAMTIKLGVVTKPGSAQNIVAEKFKETVETQAKGEIEVKIYHSNSIGSETEILQQIQLGTIQMGIITAGPFDTFDPVVRVINYPFLFKDHAQADAVLDGPLGRKILESLESVGFKGLCFSENGFRNLTNSKRPVKGPRDIKGLKIRVMDSALHRAIWQTLGANPTPMPWPIYSELEQGVIDGQENPLWVMEVYKFYEVQRYMTLTRHVYSPHIDVASLSWWKTLSAETQGLLQKAMYDAALYQRLENRSNDAGRLELLREKGFIIEENPDLEALRMAVADLKEHALYQQPQVKEMLVKILEATRRH